MVPFTNNACSQWQYLKSSMIFVHVRKFIFILVAFTHFINYFHYNVYFFFFLIYDFILQASADFILYFLLVRYSILIF